METVEIKKEKLEPWGIGGWLVLIILGLAFSAFSSGIYILNDLSVVFLDKETWNYLTSPETGLPGLSYALIYELIFHSLITLGSIYMIVIMYKMKKYFPIRLSIFWILVLVLNLINIIFTLSIYSQIPDFDLASAQQGIWDSIIRNLLTCIIWIPYLYKSKRVKNTFIL